ncbi:MAG: hypothetical protein FJZ01_19410 [Candidatus Sericytochromatia bacterium]|nr:hypothetical protein [Candidatus Tanganyikabacteria bacterium]
MGQQAAFALSIAVLAFAPVPAFAAEGAEGERPSVEVRKEVRKEVRRKFRGMHARHRGEAWAGPEVAYFTGMQLGAAGLATGGPTGVLIGRTRQRAKNDFVSLGSGSGLALQLSPASAGTGRWVTPYWGVLPRLGFGLGPLRVDLGVLAGGGAMVRTATAGQVPDLLQMRLTWLAEPRIEIGYRGERFGAGLTASYLLTPNMADLGGFAVGARLAFGGGGPRFHEQEDDESTQQEKQE